MTGATCYADVRTVDGEVYDTFRQAALARGLLKGDDEWDRAMREATVWQVPSQLRGLFVSICVFCAPDDPNALWEAHRAAMSEDFLYDVARQADPERQPGGAEELGAALHDMEAELKTHRKTLSDFNLPRPPPPRPPAGHPTRQRCRPFYAVGTGINRPSVWSDRCPY